MQGMKGITGKRFFEGTNSIERRPLQWSQTHLGHSHRRPSLCIAGYFICFALTNPDEISVERNYLAEISTGFTTALGSFAAEALSTANSRERAINRWNKI